MSKKCTCTERKRKPCGSLMCISSFAKSPYIKLWSPDNDKKPHEVSLGSGIKFKFDCNNCSHNYLTAPKHLSSGKGNGCGYCASTYMCEDPKCADCLAKSFKSNKFSEFFDKNNKDAKGNKITPRQLFKNSTKKFLFNCNNCPHSFMMQLSAITTRHHWCPYCAKHSAKLCTDKNCKNCFERSFASCEKARFFSKRNGKINPRDLALHSSKEYKFDCGCGHNFSAILDNVAVGKWHSGCSIKAKRIQNNFDNDTKSTEIIKKRSSLSRPVRPAKTKSLIITDKNCTCTDLSIRPRVLCGSVKCSNSFNSHEKAKYIIKDENSLNPSEITLGSDKVLKFSCGKCSNTFSQIVKRVVAGTWCPHCNPDPTRVFLCKDKKCIGCMPRSFMGYYTNDVASFKWSALNGEITPRDVPLATSTKYTFDCNDCNHSFQMEPTRLINETIKCCFCKGWQICGKKNCKMCWNKSVAGSPAGPLYSKNNNAPAYTMTIASLSKALFDCEKCGNEYKSTICFVVRGTRCPKCINKTEKKLNDWLIEFLKVEFTHNTSFEWCKNINCLRFDFVIDDYNIIIELDGEQHFKTVNRFKNCPIKALKDDMYKLKCAVEHGYTVIRILQEDVWLDKNDWETRLSSYLRKHNTAKVVLIDNKDEYLPMKKAINKTMDDVQVIKKFTPIDFAPSNSDASDSDTSDASDSDTSDASDSDTSDASDSDSSDDESDNDTSAKVNKKKPIMKLTKPSATKSKIIDESSDSDDDSDAKTSKRCGKIKPKNKNSAKSSKSKITKSNSNKKTFPKRQNSNSSDSD